jgi:hypothetical protein
MERNGIVFHWKEQVRNCGPGASGGVALKGIDCNHRPSGGIRHPVGRLPIPDPIVDGMRQL